MPPEGATNLVLVKNDQNAGVGDLDQTQDQKSTTDGQTQDQTQTGTDVPKKFWGQFETEDQARIAFEQMRGVLQGVVQEKQKAAAEAQAKARAAMAKRAATPLDELPIEPDEKAFLERYTTKVNNKQYTEALLLLKRDIEAKAIKTAANLSQQIAQRTVDNRDAPRKSKEEFLSNPDLADLHPVVDAAILLDQALAPHGYKKNDILQLMRNIQQSAPKKKSLDMQTPEKSQTWADLSDKDLDKQARSYWKGRLNIK